MATATFVITYTVGVAGGKEAVVTSATVDAAEYVDLTATQKKQAYFLSKSLMACMVKDGKFPAGVGGDLVA